ncbi:MarR family winged helix-turn-helix transcriptional regulator [Pseudohoeflea coraliihabitans]|uniref:MarR family transcriptional regulator n=1 Tax=Pseudohoeflea coraliihabitans TaxID=2860393 RepID=A0ABS6WLU5_9HYPH|nr:MarR family transcriptional regulator [Pseudohoeflea sp. DP4N28-3]MBW3096090.1 MarR family transcriptional regulator [Pseudohoeflea sp. DP4N28-3]
MPRTGATNPPAPPAPDGSDARTESGEEIDFQTIELLFFAYRDFISDPDAILARYGFGRAHHRVVHFVSRQPGLTVADLLETLKITKQSLARVLKQLIENGYVNQVAGPQDRRQRKLFVTPKGRELALALARPQSRRIAHAFSRLDNPGRENVLQFLAGMIDAQDGLAAHTAGAAQSADAADEDESSRT